MRLGKMREAPHNICTPGELCFLPTQFRDYEVKTSTQEELYSREARVDGAIHEKANSFSGHPPISRVYGFPKLQLRKQGYCNKNHLLRMTAILQHSQGSPVQTVSAPGRQLSLAQ